MTVQFRSRIKSAYDYGAELKSAGKCCFSDGTSEAITFLECFSRGGQFLQNPDSPCPSSSEKGHCCACSFLTTSQRNEVVANLPFVAGSPGFFGSVGLGIRSDVTECECNRIGGNWIPLTQSPTQALCTKEVIIDGINRTIDVRIPTACCSLIIQDNFPIGITCQNVCGARECANLAIAQGPGETDPFYDTTYTPNKTCGKFIVSGVDPVNCDVNNIVTRITTASSAFANDLFGPCYELVESENQYSYNCSLKTEFSCSGYWINPETIDSTVAYCNHPYSPEAPSYSNSYLNPAQYTQEEFDSLGLQIGDEFQGGIYIGQFKPLKPNATSPTKVYGSLNFGTPQSLFVNVTDESPHDKWAIVVNKTFLQTPLITSNDVNPTINTSYYDGYFNANGSLTAPPRLSSTTINSISGVQRNGFIDYYIPSIVELMFFAEQLKNNTSLLDIFELTGAYCSTSFFNDQYAVQFPTGQNTFNNVNFLYGLNFSKNENYGKTMLFGINSDVKLMLFRKIVIT